MQAGEEGNGGFLEGDAANGRRRFRDAPGRPPCSRHCTCTSDLDVSHGHYATFQTLRLRWGHTSFLEGRAMARGGCGGSGAGWWERSVPLQQLCLAGSLQTAFTTQHVYTGADYTLLLSRNSSSTTVAAQSPAAACSSSLREQVAALLGHTVPPRCTPAVPSSITGYRTPHKRLHL